MENLITKSIRDNLSYKHWWIYLVVGSIMIIIAILYLIFPNTNIQSKEIVYFCIGGFIIHDIGDIIFSTSNKTIITGWWSQTIKGVVGIFITLIIILLYVNDVSLGVKYFTVFWFLAHSICFIGESSELKLKISSGLIPILTLSLTEVILSVLFLIFALYKSNISGYFILFQIYGIIKIMLGFDFHYWNKEVYRALA